MTYESDMKAQGYIQNWEGDWVPDPFAQSMLAQGFILNADGDWIPGANQYGVTTATPEQQSAATQTALDAAQQYYADPQAPAQLEAQIAQQDPYQSLYFQDSYDAQDNQTTSEAKEVQLNGKTYAPVTVGAGFSVDEAKAMGYQTAIEGPDGHTLIEVNDPAYQQLMASQKGGLSDMLKFGPLALMAGTGALAAGLGAGAAGTYSTLGGSGAGAAGAGAGLTDAAWGVNAANTGATAGEFGLAGGTAGSTGGGLLSSAGGVTGIGAAPTVAGSGGLGLTGAGALSGGALLTPTTAAAAGLSLPSAGLTAAQAMGGIANTASTAATVPPPGASTAAQQAIDGSAQSSYDAAANAGTPGYDPSLSSGATTSAATSAISRIMDGTATAADYAQVLGGVGSGILGAVGSNAQADAYSDIANKYLNLGAPYRDRLNASYQPGFSMANQPDFMNSLNIGADAAARATSAKSGNPVDNPGAYAEMQKYISGSLALPQLNTYRSQLGTFCNLGTNTAGANDSAAAGQTSGMYNALGYGLGQATQPDNPFKGLLNQFKLNNGFGF